MLTETTLAILSVHGSSPIGILVDKNKDGEPAGCQGRDGWKMQYDKVSLGMWKAHLIVWYVILLLKNLTLQRVKHISGWWQLK